MLESAKNWARGHLSATTRHRLRRAERRLTAWPPIGLVRFGSLGRLQPISDDFGFDRGEPIDRAYIADFIARHAQSSYAEGVIRGHVLEIGEDRYASRYAEAAGSAIRLLDVLDISDTNPDATVIADLTHAPGIRSQSYDCVICTQTLLLIYDVRAAISTLHRILKPGGTLLVTVPGMSRVCRPDMDLGGDYWRFTSLSARRLFEEVFPAECVTVETYGNVLAAISFMHGLAVGDVGRTKLMVRDPNFEVLIAVKAIKPTGT